MTNNKSNNIAVSAHNSKRIKREADSSDDEEPSAKRPYYGKCQYKTGKCYNERTLKRNGDAHSLCEEHRIKQNLIQRRSDRKYQTVHAIRRRERSQRRAVLKKQVSMAVAQQLFYEHQQQKTLGIPLPQHHPLHLLTATAHGSTGAVGLAPSIQLPPSSLSFVQDLQSGMTLSFHTQSGGATTANTTKSGKTKAVAATAATKEESTPTGIDNFTPESFLNIPAASGTAATRNEAATDNGNDSHGYMPIESCTGDKETWSDDDIEFLQTILLA
ncbi:hypothetical protein PHMEG_00029814 [Phytophthora megakarya]|uniref:Uncharacterized protein n=1 Tax=Phytophthora megakarya TaxID=4795 RepID=A0A225V1I0_9STRA|nr:hypothetical protein PHMEG_00029814 [Phytophthora megakarya]